MNELSEKGIHHDLHDLAFPVDKLELLPGNPRNGNVGAVVASLEKFGQRSAIVARMKPDGETATVLAGNTRLRAARQLGWSHIAVTMVDDDDAKAAAFALADNRTHDLGEYDDAALDAMLEQVKDDYELLEATGYDLIFKAELEEKLDAVVGNLLDDPFQMENLEEPPKEERPVQRPVISFTVVFSDEEQQARWMRFVRYLKQEYPESLTLADRLDSYLLGVID